MNDQSLPKPKPPQQTPLKPGQDIKPAPNNPPKSVGPTSAPPAVPPTPPPAKPAAPAKAPAPMPKPGSVTPPSTPSAPTPVATAPPVAPTNAAVAKPTTPEKPVTVTNSTVPAVPGLPPSKAAASLPTSDPLAQDPLAHLPPSPVRAQLPPAAVTALSSVSSSKIPTSTPGGIAETITPEKPGSKPLNAPGSTPSSDSPIQGTQATFAAPKNPIMKYVPFLAIGLVVVAVVGFLITRVFGGSSSQPIQGGVDNGTPPTDGQSGGRQTVNSKQTTLTYWGLWEPTEVLAEVFKEYEAQNPGIKINYVKQSHKDYRERLQTAISSGEGPDVFRYHASWTPMLKAELAPIPSSVMSVSEFKSTYYPVASEMLQLGGQIVGIPLMYDGLALLYNKEIFDTADVTPPQTWAELRATANKLVVRSANGVQRGGIAMGGTANIEHFSDMVGLLMAQNGADFDKPNSPETRDALLFYTNFMKTDNVWTDNLPVSSVAFARGDVAMIFAPSWRIHEILATNPNIKIGVAPLPRLSEDRIAWATFWAEGINARAEEKEEAGKLLKYLSSPEVLKKLYAEASKVRSFGELYPRVDMAQELAQDPYVAAYLQDAPYAKGWYLSSYTHDNGINDQLIKYYEDAINAVITGKQVDDVLQTVSQGTTQVLRQYDAE